MTKELQLQFYLPSDKDIEAITKRVRSEMHGEKINDASLNKARELATKYAMEMVRIESSIL